MRQRRDGEPTKLGELISTRMRELGIARQVDLARRAGISESTAGRLIWAGGFVPDRDTLLGLAQALHLDPVQLVVFALDITDDEPDQRLDPLVARVDRLVHTLPDTELRRLRIVLDATLASFDATEPGDDARRAG